MRKMQVLLFVFALLHIASCEAGPVPAASPEPIPAPQILDPSSWTWKAEPTGKGEYKIIVTAKIDKGWHTYSQFIGEGGPVPTALTFDKDNKNVQLIGKPTETGTKVHTGFDAVFEMNLKYFENDLVLEQKIKVLKDTKLKGTLEFMLCDDKSCLPPDIEEFEFDLKAGGAATPKTDTSKTKTQGSINDIQQAFDSAVQSVIQQEIIKDSTTQAAVTTAGTENKYGEPVSDCGTAAVPDDLSIWAIIGLGFLGGLVALITPCVFPMIPLTVSFFTKRSESKTKGKFEALIYSFSIVFIYFLLAVPFLIFDISPDTLSEISTGSLLNVFFFAIFAIFAFSFFGFYEIELPNFIANKADSASNVGGIVGIFFMALTLAIVSFSCTGPILGTLLVSTLTAAGGKLNFVAGMTSFGFALALPFGLFALFPDMMKSLPKSGGWLDTVKKVLGFIELIFAFKFLSNADMVSHWGILPREIFLGIWALLGAGLFLFLIGKFKLPHTTPVTKFSLARVSAALLALMFTVYSAYGIPGNDLHLFSGFPPPKSYSIFRTASVTYTDMAANKSDSNIPVDLEPIQNDYEKALAIARKQGKPLMIDFTGWACVNCRKMEENVWTDSAVYKRLTQDFVVLSLYVDDKKELPKEEQRMSEFFKGKKIKTVGNKFSEMQARYFGKNAQPYYVLVTPDEKLLNNPVAYTPNAKEYTAWLDCGLNAFEELNKQ